MYSYICVSLILKQKWFWLTRIWEKSFLFRSICDWEKIVHQINPFVPIVDGGSFKETQRTRVLCKWFTEEVTSEGGWGIRRGRGLWRRGCGFSWRAAGTPLAHWMLWSLHPVTSELSVSMDFRLSLEWLCLSTLGKKSLWAGPRRAAMACELGVEKRSVLDLWAEQQ